MSRGLPGAILLVLSAACLAEETTENVVLDTASLWRWQISLGTELMRTADGELVPIHPQKVHQRLKRDGKYVTVLRRHERHILWPPPPAGWTAADLDDARWSPRAGPFGTGGSYTRPRARYRCLGQLRLRGKFHVDDPAAAGGMRLSVAFHGGLAVYLNGKELARAFLPPGELTADTAAQDYPLEAYADDDGLLLDRKFPDKNFADRYRMRRREIKDVSLPVSMLLKGVNVLALDVRRAPAPELFFTAKSRRNKTIYTNPQHVRQFAWWSRIAVASVRLTAPAGAAVTANAGHLGRPKGVRIWQRAIHQRVYPTDFENAFEPAGAVSIRLRGARNGAYSGQVIVSGDAALGGVRAKCSPLAGPGGATIAGDALQIRYALADAKPARSPVHFEGLEEHPPDAAGAVQPIWLTVRVPPRAAPGSYEGTLTVRVAEAAPLVVPVTLRVVDWTLPDSKDFFAHVGLWQSPDSVAMQYGEKLWSPRHWQLLDRTFDLLGQIGVDILHVTAIRRTHAGNRHSMIRYHKRPDGTLVPDFGIVERYVALAAKYLGTVPIVCLYAWDTFDSSGKKHFGHYARKDRPILLSVRDAATGELLEEEGPAWGTPECRAFWKRVVDGLRTVLAKHGLADSLMLGVAGDFEPTATALTDLRQASGGAKWVFNSHVCRHTIGPEKKDLSGYIASAWGGHTSHVDPDFGRGYGWKNPFIRAMTRWFPRYPITQRLALESLVTSRIMPRKRGDLPEFGLHGIGRIGADFWPVLKDRRGRGRPLAARYPDTEWGQLGLDHSLLALLSPGKDGAIGTVQFEMLRENLQEIEARIFLEKALADEGTRAKLGRETAAAAEALLDDRVRVANLAYAERDRRSALGIDVSTLSACLYETAARVGRLLR